MAYTRRRLGTIIHATILTTSTISLVYGLKLAHKDIAYLSTKEPSDGDYLTELAILGLIIVTLIRTFFIIVSFLYLSIPKLIMWMYKSEGRFLLFVIHTILSVGVSLFVSWSIILFGEFDHEVVLLSIDAVFLLQVIDATSLFAASVSMWSGVNNPLFPWKTVTSSTKPKELAEQMV